MMIKLFMKYFMMLIFSLILFSSCGDDNQNDVDEVNLNKEIENARLTELSEIYFVGNYAGNLSVYKYDYKTDKSKVFWHSNDERVIDLLISPD